MADERLTVVEKAIQDCKDENLLTGFWEKLTPEDINMIAAEFSLEMDLETERKKGYKEGLEKVAQNALAEGFPVELVSKITMMDIEKVRELSCTVQA